MTGASTVAPLRAPGPPGAPLVGSAFALRRGQVRFFCENWRTYGDVVRFRLGPLVAHILAHPDHIHHVLSVNARNYHKGPSWAKTRLVLGSGLLVSEGEPWRRHRRLMQPPFTARSVERLGGEMTGAVETMLVGWQLTAASGSPLAINREMAHLALTIVGRTIFGTDLGANAEALLKAAVEAEIFVNRRLASVVDIPLAVPTPGNRRVQRALRSFDTVIDRFIEVRRRQNRDAQDLLGALLAAQDDETGATLSDQEIRDQVLTILLAGHETAALALTWTWYLLAQHPEVEDTLHAELGRVLADRAPTVADLAALPYTRMVIEEAMRLYPPVWTFPRAAIADDEIGGYHVPAGSLMFPSQYLAHRHPAFWERPEAFDPERFAPERAKDRVRHAYFPFGGGPRTCLGFHFAMVELCLVLAAIAQRYRLRLVPGLPIEPVSRITLHPSRDVLMTLEHR